MTDGASGGEEPSDEVCESADPPVSFKSDVWKYFGSQVMIKDKNGDGLKQHANTSRL